MPILAKETDQFPADLFDLADSDESAQWHLLYTRSRREKDLMRRLLAEQIPFYGPCATKKSRSPSGRVRSVWTPLFSNYVFLLGGPEEVLTAQKTNCVSRVSPVVDKVRLTEDLRRLSMLISTDAPIQIEQKLCKGECIRIRSGPFSGCEGIVVKRRGDSHLVVNISFVQQSVSVALDDFLVERL